MVLVSTPKSLKNREVSFLAIIEVILAVSLYWSIAVYYDIYWHILSSILIAPLFLLRSKKSNKIAINEFRKGTESKYYINGAINKGKQVIGRFLFVIIVTLIINIFFDISIYIVIVMSVSFIFHAVSDDIIIAYFSKTCAIIKTINHGYKYISANWFYSTFLIDFKQFPELLYGIENSNLDDYKISWMIKKIFISDGFSRIAILLVLLLIFPFAIFYRLSIKSTFWFYIPLLFVVQSPNLNTSQNIGKFLSELYQTIWAWIRALLAIGTVGAFVITNFEWLNWSVSNHENSPINTILMALYIDFSSLELWKIFQFSVAILTIGLFLYANAMRKPNIENNIPLKKDANIQAIFYLNSLRNWLSFFYLLSAFVFVANYFQVWEYKYVPDFFHSFFITLLEYVRYVPFS